MNGPSANLFHKCLSVFQSQLFIVCQMLVCKYNVNTCLKQNICLTQIYFSHIEHVLIIDNSYEYVLYAFVVYTNICFHNRFVLFFLNGNFV